MQLKIFLLHCQRIKHQNTMEKLESKHLAPYLPYGLKIEVGTKKLTLSTTHSTLGIHMDMVLQKNDLYKPILWSLSDLTEEMVKDCDYISKEDMIRSIESGHVPYKIWLDLVSNDWDVFGLIEKGLAIDVNTID